MSENEQRRRRADELRGTREQRSFQADFELRDNRADGTVTMIGHASVTEHPYDIGDPKNGGYTEVIARQAFKRSLSQQPPPQVVLLANHAGLPLASVRGGGLFLEEDDRGLKFTAELDAEDPDVDRVVRKVRRGDLTGASFAFRATDQTWSDDFSQRRIKSVELSGGDVSVTTYGANPAASVAVRAAEFAAARRPLPNHTTRAREHVAVLRAEFRADRELAIPVPIDDVYRSRMAHLRAL